MVLIIKDELDEYLPNSRSKVECFGQREIRVKAFEQAYNNISQKQPSGAFDNVVARPQLSPSFLLQVGMHPRLN